MTPTVAGIDGAEFPQPPPPDEFKPAVVSELETSRQPDQLPFCTSLPHPFAFAVSGPALLAGSFCAASFEVVQVFEEPHVPSDEPHVLVDEPQAPSAVLLDEPQALSVVLLDDPQALFVVLLDEPQVVPDDPQALSDEVGTEGVASVVTVCVAG